MYAAEPIIGDYLHDTKQIYRLYDFYDQDIVSTQTAVYFIGSSVVGDAVTAGKLISIYRMQNTTSLPIIF